MADEPPEPPPEADAEAGTHDAPPLTREEAIAQDRRDVKEIVHAHHIRTFAPDFCLLVSHRTAYRRLTMQLTFPQEYPLKPVHVELQSELLPPKLLTKLGKMAEDKLGEPGVAGRPQVTVVYTLLDDMVHDNRLLYATPEVRQCLALSNAEPTFRLLVNDKEGTLKIRARCGRYELKATLIVPEEYPAEQLQVEITSCSFPASIWTVYLQQAREIARRCQLGVPTEKAVHLSTTMIGVRDAPPVASVAGAGANAGSMTTATLHGLKDDVKFLKQATDLRAVDAAYNKMLHKFDYSTSIRRKARRELRKRTQAEMEKELLAEQQAAEEAERNQMREWRRMLGMSEDGPQRSIKAVVTFLTHDFLFRLPNERSAESGKPVFPEDPAELQRLVDKRKPTRPVRVPTCGCFFIFSELDTFLTTPPFGKPCPRAACNGAVVQHPDWPHDVKKLERAWAMKEAREREIAEVSDMFGLDESFQA